MSLASNTAILTRLEGAILIYLGILFFLNAIFHLTKINKKKSLQEVFFINAYYSILFFIIFGEVKDIYSIEIGGIALFFSCLYLWHDFNIIFNISNEGIGYFCLYFLC
ncbi:AmiS/UreI family transporter [Legionella tunisiensis]|uniref:AmiS/UreI family transporter n=1 Tax=Legionella tunisiensis TaxID=1034944 RepID=UPI0003720C30|nr:AmiS/UreI family transporter [Legionella tunisiensis]